VRALVVVLAACAGPVATSDAQIVIMDGAVGAADPAASELWTMDLDGSHREQLTHNARMEFLPHFSPDATHLVYTIYTSGVYGAPDAKTDIGIYDFATRREANLTNTGTDSYPVWSPDGKRLAFLTTTPRGLGIWIMNADGSDRHRVIEPVGPPSEITFGDIAWSSNNWILFVVASRPNACFKTHLDVIRPDGTERTQVTDGGPSCTPEGREQSGDADPGFFRDGDRIASSRGLPHAPTGAPDAITARRTVVVANSPWVAGKPETELDVPGEPDCVEGVPKPSPHDDRILLYRSCFDRPDSKAGIYVTDEAGTARTFVTTGFGPDWNPTVP
jgi:Tol biopolymer transport system component